MTDLSAKFNQLEAQLANQHTALMQKLEAMRTAIRGITFDTAPILSAIVDLRGEGPENTIKSVNQSIWNVAGPAPGKSLTDIHTILAYINAGLNAGTAGNYSPYAITTNSRLMELIILAEKLNAAVGADPYGDLELASMRGFLSALIYCCNELYVVMEQQQINPGGGEPS